MIYIINEYPEPTRNRWYPTWNPNQNLLSTYYEIWPALKPIKMTQYGWWRSLEWRTTNQTWKGILETIVLNQTKHEDHTSQARISLGHGVFRDVRKIPIFGHIDLIRPPDDLVKFLFLNGERLHYSIKPKSGTHSNMPKKASRHVLDRWAQSKVFPVRDENHNKITLILFEAIFDQPFPLDYLPICIRKYQKNSDEEALVKIIKKLSFIA